MEIDAKIDTGADSTSIDTELAKKLGFEDALHFFENIPKSNSTDRKTLKQISDEYDTKYVKAHPDIQSISFTYSASGVSMRPKVEITFTMNSVKIRTKTSIIDRSNLEYPVIIGRKDLRKFLVDTSK